MLYDTDRRLLRLMQRRPDLSTQALAQEAGVSPATAWRRLERLQRQGIIRGTRREIVWRALGWEIEVSLRVTLDKTAPDAFDRFLAAAREVPEVIEIQTLLGRVDVRLSVIARDLGHWQEIYRQRILRLPNILEIEALMLVSTVHRSEGLPL